jgi:CubicO group peptidase (beta-lactamase class C family)
MRRISFFAPFDRSYTTGIPDYFDESVMSGYADVFRDYPNYRIRSSKDVLPLFIDKPMMYTKGKTFKYNNSGYVVLGLVIEGVTGQPFDAYLDAAVFQPLGMHDTGYFELDRLPAKCANAYIFDEQTRRYYTNIYSVDAKGTGAGGAFTTASDVERFWQGLSHEKVISRDMFSLMTSPQVNSRAYGYGFWLAKDGSPYFQGSDPGVSFISSFDEDRQLIVTVVSNLGQDVWTPHRGIRIAALSLR